MNIQEFKKMAVKTEVNTCNGWGFGGYFGKLYELGSLKFRNAKWSYRHANPTKYDGYFHHDKEISKSQFEYLLESIEYIEPPKKVKLAKVKPKSKNPPTKQTELF